MAVGVVCRVTEILRLVPCALGIHRGKRRSDVCGKIALQLVRGGDAGGKRRSPDFLVPFLIPPEPKFVFQDRAADVVAVVVPAEFGFAGLILVRKEVISV